MTYLRSGRPTTVPVTVSPATAKDTSRQIHRCRPISSSNVRAALWDNQNASTDATAALTRHSPGAEGNNSKAPRDAATR
jgi:hypothetical protein